MKSTIKKVIKRLSSMDGAVENMRIEEVEEEIISSVGDLEEVLSDLEDISDYVGQVSNNIVDLESLL